MSKSTTVKRAASSAGSSSVAFAYMNQVVAKDIAGVYAAFKRSSTGGKATSVSVKKAAKR
jgi:hypothetical protein